VEDAFGILIWVVAAVGAVVAAFTLAATARGYREIGGGGMSGGDDDERPAQSHAAERDAEIRQLLQARNARRERRGEAPLDIDRQIAELSPGHPPADPELRGEIRDHVLARNARRVRAGEEPLDVEAEVVRRLGELT